MNDDRIKWIDSARGIAIILVVIGHVVGGYTGKYSMPMYNTFVENVVRVIYMFHMPLFFIISGYCYSINEKKWGKKLLHEYIQKKARQLMIPYFVFATLQILVKLPMQGKISSVLSWHDILLLSIKPVDQFWFIYVLFLIYVFNAFLEYKNKEKPRVIVSVILYIISVILIQSGSKIVSKWLVLLISVSNYYLFFLIGIIFQKRKILIAKLPTFLCFMVFSFTALLNIKLDFGVVGDAVMKFPLALLGSVVVIGISQSFNIISECKMLYFIGKMTMPIYIIHVLLCAIVRIGLLKIGITNLIISLIIGTILSIYVPIFIYILWCNTKAIVMKENSRQR